MDQSSVECPVCSMRDALVAADGYECGTCGHEWLADEGDGLDNIRDANGNLLANGDTVVVVKGLKLNGKSGGVKVGTKIKSIRLVAGDHEVDGKVDGRALLIRAAFVKKA